MALILGQIWKVVKPRLFDPIMLLICCVHVYISTLVAPVVLEIYDISRHALLVHNIMLNGRRSMLMLQMVALGARHDGSRLLG